MMDDILQKNIKGLAKYNALTLKELQGTDFSKLGSGVVYDTSITGSRDVYFIYNEKKYLLHSKYNPVAEASKIIKDVDAAKDSLIVVFGIGLGYHLFELKNKISKETRVILVEHNIDVLKYAFTHIDFTSILESGQFLLLCGDEEQVGRMALNLLGLNFYNLVHNIQVVTLPNYYVYAKENKSALQHISKNLLNTVMSYGNDLKDQFVGFANLCHNTDAILKSNSIDAIRGKYKNVPAIIVAAGPSLDKNIQYLKEANGKALIIACDASIRACEKHGVRADAIASIERDEPTYTFYYKDRSFPKDLVLIAPGSIWPKIYDEFEGKTIITSRNSVGFETLWTSTFDNFQFVSQGHSCATVAFAAARDAGCNPIILIGQDLAYTSGKKHSDLTHTEYEGENNDRDSTGIYLEDSEGNLLKSHIVYKMFKEWFEFQILSEKNLQVINATEGGAYIKGTTLMTLHEAINTYCLNSLEKPMYQYLPEPTIDIDRRTEKYTKLIDVVGRDLNILKNIKKIALEHLKMLVRIEKNVYQDSDNKQLEKIILKLQRGDKIIRKLLETESISCYYKQIIIQTIMQVKKIGNQLTIENVQRNHLLQHNLMFMIVNSIDLIIEEYQNAKSILEQKN